jgi:hydrogenase expression/formation protein HypE
MSAVHFEGPACPMPMTDTERVQLGHGSGGKLSAALIRDHFFPHLGNPFLATLADGAVLPRPDGELVVSTDSFVVSPLEFPGGDIGVLAVHGTLNDVAMMGARPLYITAGFILEEGLPFDVLDRIIASMARVAREAGVPLVAGDTKVVERGKADGLYINTTGIGARDLIFRPGPARAEPGDIILLSGPLARHGMAIMAVREGLAFESEITSDTANLSPLVEVLREKVGDCVAALRDPTRGGLASALNEIAQSSRVGMELEEAAIPVPADVHAACEMLGLDPLYVANEGVLTAIVRPDQSEAALQALRAHPVGAGARIIGRVVDDHPGYVVLRTLVGGTRIVDMLPGDQLPRIC